MDTLDFAFAPIAAIACIAVYLCLLWKYPSGVVFIGFTTYGIAWVSFGGAVNYARVVFGLQIISATYFAYTVLKTRGADRILQFLTSKYSILLWFLVIIWCKIAFDILNSGVDEFRLDGLKAAAQTVLLPSIVFFMAAVGTDPWRFASGIMIGMVGISVAFVAPTIPGMILEGRIVAALFGEDRLTVYNMDTINGGRFFFMGAIGSIALLSVGGMRGIRALVLLILCGVFCLLLLLNGTRQFILGSCVAALLCSYSLFRAGGVIRIVVGVLAAGVIGYSSYRIFQTASVGDRLSSEGLARELTISRGSIWKRAFDAGIESPLTGAGFRRFGDVAMSSGQSEVEYKAELSGAHGFFQDIWAEHGAVWGIIGFLIFLYTLRLMLGRLKIDRHTVLWSHFGALIALVVPLFMSGAVFSGSGMHLFALSMYIAFAKHKIDQAQQHVINIESKLKAEAIKKEMDILKGRA